MLTKYCHSHLLKSQQLNRKLFSKIFFFSENFSQNIYSHKSDAAKKISIPPSLISSVLPFLDGRTLTSLDKAIIDPVARQYLNNSVITERDSIFRQNATFIRNIDMLESFLYNKHQDNLLRMSDRRLEERLPCPISRNYLSSPLLKDIICQRYNKISPMRQYLHARDGPFQKLPFQQCIGPGLEFAHIMDFGEEFFREQISIYRQRHKHRPLSMFRDTIKSSVVFELFNEDSCVAFLEPVSTKGSQYVSFTLSDLPFETTVANRFNNTCSIAIGVIRPIDFEWLQTQRDITQPFDLRKVETHVLLAKDPSYNRNFDDYPCHDMIFIGNGRSYRISHDQLVMYKKGFSVTTPYISELGLLLNHDEGRLSYYKHGVYQTFNAGIIRGPYIFFLQINGDSLEEEELWRLSYPKPKIIVSATTFR